MDNIQLNELIALSPLLKHKFSGCFASNTFPALRADDTFQLINSAPFGEFGEHWLLLVRVKEEEETNEELDGMMLIFYDSSGRPLKSSFPNVYERFLSLYSPTKCNYHINNNANAIAPNVIVKQLFPSQSLTQPSQTTICGLYCIFVAHYIFGGRGGTLCNVPLYATTEDVLRFVSDNYGINFSRYNIFL